MNRYTGDSIGTGARIALISNDALGNFVVVTPLLQMLRFELKPKQLDYYGGNRTWELQSESDLFDWSFPLHGSSHEDRAAVAREKRGYDLVINVENTGGAKVFARMLTTESTRVCGPCEDLHFGNDDRGKLWEDPDWTAKDLVQRYPFLKTQFIGEIFCRLAYLGGEVPTYKVRSEIPLNDIPQVLISTAGTLPEKLWPAEKWIEMLRFFASRKMSVGLLGAAPLQQSKFWKGGEAETRLVETGLLHDLRGKLTLPQVVGALQKAKLVLTLDNGILHLAVAAKTPTVGIYRYGIHRLWAPPSDSLEIITSQPSGAVNEIPVGAVQEAVCRAL